MPLRMGEILVNQGLLTIDQVNRILEIQSDTGRPFGELAETLFDLSGEDVEKAWAEQYSCITQTLDPCAEEVDSKVLGLINRRQAWQFGILPIRFDSNEVMVATTLENLPRAARFVAWNFEKPVYFVISEMDLLEEALQKHFPLPGVSLYSGRSDAYQ